MELSKMKASVAITRELLEFVDEESHLRQETRSAIIEEALRLWQRQKLEQSLAHGYRAMSTEDSKTAGQHLPLAKEVLR